MRIFALLSLALAVATAAPSKPSRIIGGSVTSIDKYPFSAAMLFSFFGDEPFVLACGAIIINNRALLSAAHCYFRLISLQFRARVGSSYHQSGGFVHGIRIISNNREYESFTMDSDVSVLQVSTPFVFNDNVSPASIAGPNYVFGDNQALWAMGWGQTIPGGPKSPVLRDVQLWSVNQDECIRRYSELGRLITDNMFCAGWLDIGGRDQCQGDSGGAVLHNNVVVGITSWGEGCAHERYPGVNVRVSRFTSWIVSQA